MKCCDEGLLRSYLDAELSPADRAALEAHLHDCASCRTQLDELRARAARVGALLRPAPETDTAHALAQMRSRIANADESDIIPVFEDTRRSKSMEPVHRLWASPRRGLLAGIAAIVAVLSLLALPPVRAAADQLLQIFRVQNVVFVPVNPERMEQLQQLDIDAETLFIAEPEVVNNPAPPRTVASVDEANAAVGFAVQQPVTLPSAPVSTTIQVTDRSTMQFQVNVESARQVLTAMGVNDVTLPDSLGAEPIVADVAPAVHTIYSGDTYELMLFQGRSPDITLPDGVDLRQLGKAALRLLGTAPEQAEAMSQQIDWSTTLLFPIPTDVRAMQQVTINGANGLLVSGRSDGEEAGFSNGDEDRRGQRGQVLYWQNGDRFYVLQASGRMSQTDLIAAAESIR
jgi:hypothetical protein